MSWTDLPVNYTDAVFEGNRKYNMITNPDGTVSFVDVTEYTNQANSEFGASDANAMNKAINDIMSGGELMSKTMYDSNGAVEAAAGIDKYVTANALLKSQRATANGVAPLDGNSKVTTTYLPISSATNLASTAYVATASAVKAAYDKAAAATLSVAANTSGISQTAYASENSDYSATLTVYPVKYGRLVFAYCFFNIESGIGVGYSFPNILSSYKPIMSFNDYAGPVYQTKGTFNNHYRVSVDTDGSVSLTVYARENGENAAASYNNVYFTLCYISAS